MNKTNLAGLLALSASAASAMGGVTFHQPTRSVAAITQANGATDSLTSQSLEPLIATVQQSAPVIVNGQTVTTDAIAAISCTFDPTSVRGRTRLQGNGVASATTIATTLIDVLVTVDASNPWRLRSDAELFSTNGQSTLAMSLTNHATGQVVFATSSGASGASDLEVAGVLAPGTYRFIYDARLVAATNGGDRDFILKFDVPCPADVDDGTAQGNGDGAVTIDDLLFFLTMFESGNLDADIDNGSGQAVADGAVTIDDLLYFLARFEAGC
jgi:hypothetical protein